MIGNQRAAYFLWGLIALAGDACAHEFWIEPSAYQVQPDQWIPLRLRIGQNFSGEYFPRSSGLIRDFIVEGPEGTSQVRGFEGADPAGYILPVSSGLYIVGYQSLPYSSEVEAATFERYLIEEGLESIALIRQREGTVGQPAMEHFSRSAKALLQVGTEEFRVSTQPMNLRIELLPDLKGFPLRTGERITVQLFYEGEPLVGSLVSAFSKKNPLAKQMTRTDNEGRVTFRLNDSGPWQVKSVHMLPGDGTVDWESFWASLTFEVQRE